MTLGVLCCLLLTAAFQGQALSKEKGGSHPQWHAVSEPQEYKGFEDNNYDSGHHAHLLKDGRVLLISDSTEVFPILSSYVEIFNPATGLWKSAPSPKESRSNFASVLLSDGKVLLVGGWGSDSAEIFDPTTEEWAPAGEIPFRFGATATTLKDGRVLVVGGAETNHGPIFNDAYLFDPARKSWTQTGSVGEEIVGHEATLLRDGRVLVTGGRGAGHGIGKRAAWLFDPIKQTWRSPNLLNVGRGDHAAVLLKNGSVLITGGDTTPGYLQKTVKAEQIPSDSEVFDPKKETFAKSSAKITPRIHPSTAVLEDGEVFIGGGYGLGGQIDPRNDTKQFQPAPPQFLNSENNAVTSGAKIDDFTGVGSATVLSGPLCVPHCGKLLLVGARGPVKPILYSPPDQVVIPEPGVKGDSVRRVIGPVILLGLLTLAAWRFRGRSKRAPSPAPEGI